jgi:hypothetical protein
VPQSVSMMYVGGGVDGQARQARQARQAGGWVGGWVGEQVGWSVGVGRSVIAVD